MYAENISHSIHVQPQNDTYIQSTSRTRAVQIKSLKLSMLRAYRWCCRLCVHPSPIPHSFCFPTSHSILFHQPF